MQPTFPANKQILLASAAALLIALLVIAITKKRNSQNRGRDEADDQLGYAEGVADSVGSTGARAAAKWVQGLNAVEKSARGAVEDARRLPYKIENLNQAGVRFESCKLNPSNNQSILVYTIAEKDVASFAKIQVYDNSNKEIGRCKYQIKMKADAADALSFEFPPSTDLNLAGSASIIIDNN